MSRAFVRFLNDFDSAGWHVMTEGGLDRVDGIQPRIYE